MCRYKAQFAPSELLCRTCLRWVPITPSLLAALDGDERQPDLCAASQAAGTPPLPSLLSRPQPRMAGTLQVARVTPDACAGQDDNMMDAASHVPEHESVSDRNETRSTRRGIQTGSTESSCEAWSVMQMRVRLWGGVFGLSALEQLVDERGWQLVRSMCAELVQEAGAAFAAQCLLLLD